MSSLRNLGLVFPDRRSANTTTSSATCPPQPRQAPVSWSRSGSLCFITRPRAAAAATGRAS
ncbi:hypothetical protein J6590_080221 [Homalodisca vitripennis]|nr:hypothetical protein J6590_080221 [Homalodisca vitripennis]